MRAAGQNRKAMQCYRLVEAASRAVRHGFLAIGPAVLGLAQCN